MLRGFCVSDIFKGVYLRGFIMGQADQELICLHQSYWFNSNVEVPEDALKEMRELMSGRGTQKLKKTLKKKER